MYLGAIRLSFWVKANSSFCADLPAPECELSVPANNVCVCNSELCPDRSEFCSRGRSLYLLLGEDGFFSNMPGKNNVTFVGDFETKYDVTIRPYSGITTNTFIGPVHLESTPNCMEQMLQDRVVNESFAAHLCCEAGHSFLTPRNVTVFGFVPDFVTGSVTAFVTWFDPTEEGKLFSEAVARLDDAVEVNGTPAVAFKLPMNDFFATLCDNSTAYMSTLVGLEIGRRYDLNILVNYSRDHIQCGNDIASCRTEIEFLVELDVCNFNICDVNADCVNGLNSFDFNCTCREGFEGIGFNNLTGGGCMDKDFCSPETNPCVPEAECSDNIAPEIGTRCQCKSGFYGDGISGQSGCSSILNLALAISLPLLALSHNRALEPIQTQHTVLPIRSIDPIARFFPDVNKSHRVKCSAEIQRRKKTVKVKQNPSRFSKRCDKLQLRQYSKTTDSMETSAIIFSQSQPSLSKIPLSTAETTIVFPEVGNSPRVTK
uniref:Uncharacterized protein LOC100183125 n=1 Tax=Phallusia mammillata TaxID=59560 RepID=A0A6F9DIP4_9ASCI|nr:uncharacterized protein LOC100183125 [Phallusia mammillata]